MSFASHRGGAAAIYRTYATPMPDPKLRNPADVERRKSGFAEILGSSDRHRRDDNQGIRGGGAFASSLEVSAGGRRSGSGMAVSLDFHTLRCAYRSGEATPAAVIREVISRAEQRGNDGVWISRVPDGKLLDEAAALERRAAAEGIATLPLYGVPFAVKDNIDVAGLPTTA